MCFLLQHCRNANGERKPGQIHRGGGLMKENHLSLWSQSLFMKLCRSFIHPTFLPRKFVKSFILSFILQVFAKWTLYTNVHSSFFKYHNWTCFSYFNDLLYTCSISEIEMHLSLDGIIITWFFFLFRYKLRCLTISGGLESEEIWWMF